MKSTASNPQMYVAAAIKDKPAGMEARLRAE